MAYNFLPYNQDQLFLMPPSLREWVGEGSLARFVSDVVDGFDDEGKLAAFYEQYRMDGWGRASYHPRLMLKILLYGCAIGVTSSRKLAAALEQDVGFRYLAANQHPDFRTISDFRKNHLKAIEGLFVQVLKLCEQANLVKLGVVALDGRKVAGNASAQRNRTREQLVKVVQQYLADADEVDRQEDELYGADHRGDELPQDLREEKGRREKLRKMIAELDAEKEQVLSEHDERMQARAEEEARTGRKKRGRKPKVPAQKLKQLDEQRRNLTDPESRIMQRRGSWIQGYNGQAIVDCESQVIVAHDLTNDVTDHAQLEPLLQRCKEYADRFPATCLADAGYWSETNAQLGAGTGTDLYIAVERNRSGRKRGVSQGPEAVKMRAKLESDENKELYQQRSSSVEPVFGQMWTRGLHRFLTRGRSKVHGEWSLWCTTHNLLKLWRHQRLCTVR